LDWDYFIINDRSPALLRPFDADELHLSQVGILELPLREVYYQKGHGIGRINNHLPK
jgi:hypothetical protein